MSRPVVSNFAESIYAQFPDAIRKEDANHDYALLIYAGAIGAMFEDIDIIAHAQGGNDPWTILLDIERLGDNAIPWIGQFLGVSVDTSLPPDEQRQQIRDHTAWDRGTPKALKESIRPLLTGTKTVELAERSSSAWTIEVSTYYDESPGDTTYENYYQDYADYTEFYNAWGSYQLAWEDAPREVILNTLKANKPAGIILTYSIIPGSPGTTNSYQTVVFIPYENYRDLWLENQTYQHIYEAM